MAGIEALEGQTVLDLAIQECGSVEAAFQLAVANGLSVTDELAPGQSLQAIDPVEKPVAGYYQNNKLKPATSDLTETEADLERIFDEEFPLELA